jgi:uncharacterized membrane protein (UPF0182 family)
MPRRPLRYIVLFLLAILVFAGPSLLRFYTDWLWFGEIGYQQVFLTMLRSQGTLFTIAFVVSVIWLTVNLRVALAAVGDARPVFTTREGMEVTLPGRRQMQTIASGIALVLSIFIALFASSQWETWLAWRNAAAFGQADPILGRDVGFYVFTLPFMQFARGLAQSLVVIAALASGAVYFASGSLTSRFGSMLTMTPGARRHLSLLAAVFLLLLAFGAWLGQAERLVQQSSGVFFGPGYADVNGRMPAALLLSGVAVLGAVLALMQAFTPRNWPIPLAIGLYVAVTIGGEIYSTMLQRFVVSPNEQTRESPFIQHNIDATRRAFALDRVETQELTGDATLTRDDITDNASTIANVRLWDHQPLLDTFGQLQVIRTYYDFESVDNDRYRIGGALRQIMLSPRELNTNSLPNRTWVNDRLTFTHGYGLTLGPVNQVTQEGLPVLYTGNLPLETIPEIPIVEPSLYFGELSNDYVIVRTSTREFHYPRGEDNVFTQYDGTGGVVIGSFWRKLVFAIRFGAYQMLLSDDINADSRILYLRNIRDRVRRLAPFLTFDRDPYLVVADGRLFWIYDAYTTSSRYPYATPAGGLNYIRNAVKIVIDAYHGTTTVYLADAQDPIAATYARMFPGMFTPLDQMPASLREHVRYPEDIFALQASVFATYHMTQPAVFYNREDQWEVPIVEDVQNAAPLQPYYTIMRLPGEAEPEFIQMLPFTPRNRDNLAAWLAARSDGEHYGTLRAFQFPKQKVIFGPRQVVARIAQDQTIAPQITLWNQQGSQVIWGTLMVIPIEESLIYVRPLYLRASGGRIPELTRVIVAYQNEIVMEETLDAALARLFGIGGQPRPDVELVSAPVAIGAPAATTQPQGAQPAATPATTGLAAEARQHYDRALEAQRAGDWARYGEEIRLLGDVLARMRQ